MTNTPLSSRRFSGNALANIVPPVLYLEFATERVLLNGRFLWVMVGYQMLCCCLWLTLLGSMLGWPELARAGSPDWGTGFYRLNPSQEPAFESERNREEARRRAGERRRFDRSAPESRSAPLPWGWGEERDTFDSRSRYERPWGEVPPEWRNEDLERRLPREEYPSSRRPARRSYVAPEEPWSIPEDEIRDERGGWDYPYPERAYRRRDPYPATPYYYEDRLDSRRYRRRPPHEYENAV